MKFNAASPVQTSTTWRGHDSDDSDSDEGWIDVLSAPTEAPVAVPVPAKDTAGLEDVTTTCEAESGALEIIVDVELYTGDRDVLGAGEAGESVMQSNSFMHSHSASFAHTHT
ncbi:Mitogen-activated protein kinase kinase kinase 3 [Hordeum vulgare]|nr:Mitogen-activated protein kinase kinase kinase 3 [Hordeum vulgare]